MMQRLKPLLPLGLPLLLAACGSGDEYDPVDSGITSATPNRFLTFFNTQQGGLDADELTVAYYDAVDPANARDTLQKYIALHGLDDPDQHVIFRDSKDLGYGRDMYMVSYPNPSACGGQVIAFYVRNFSVEIVDGFAYGPVNLDAAINGDLQHHVGTNAIEWSRGRADIGDTCSSEPYNRFFTYEPRYSSAAAPHPRRTRVDLDGRGAKAMPQPCITCHGGILRPLDRFDRFVAVHANDEHDPGNNVSDIGDVKARLQAFEVDTFEFAPRAGHRRGDYEEGLRRLNAAIYCTYPGSAGHPACADFGGGQPAQADIGEWDGEFAREMMLGWYGDDAYTNPGAPNNALGDAGATFDYDYVPAGWRPGIGGPPEGADTLFLKVVGPNCFVCHGKQGTQLPSNNDPELASKDLDFRSWRKFISYADDIERLVFDEGRMPLGLLNYNHFWNDREKAELLASFLAPHVSDPDGFSARRTDSSGAIIPPGRAVARAGPDRVTRPGDPITLSAGASLFVDRYAWEVVSAPGGASVELTDPASETTDFSADTDGEYLLRLVARSTSSGSSAGDTIRIAVDSTLATAPRDLRFYGDVATFVSAAGNGNCVLCHSSGLQPGIPAWWVADPGQPAGVVTGVPTTTADPPALGLYEQIMVRVNLDYVEDSPFLRKPSGKHHFGGLVNGPGAGLDTSLDVGAAGRADYDMLVNWISEGALCGGSASECP